MNPVQAQLDAYNARDVERFVACYAADVVVEDGRGRALARGVAQLRADYAELFAQHPGLHCELIRRMVVGEYVVDEEIITGRGEPLHAIVIYRVERDQIAQVRILR